MQAWLKTAIALSILAAIVALPLSVYAYRIFYADVFMVSRCPGATREGTCPLPFIKTFYVKVPLFMWAGLLIVWLPLWYRLSHRNKGNMPK
jgi:hypothetical protein